MNQPAVKSGNFMLIASIVILSGYALAVAAILGAGFLTYDIVWYDAIYHDLDVFYDFRFIGRWAIFLGICWLSVGISQFYGMYKEDVRFLYPFPIMYCVELFLMIVRDIVMYYTAKETWYFHVFNVFLNPLTIVAMFLIPCARGQDFGYDGAKGPSHWGEQFNTCTGKHQSPININSLNVKKVNLPPLIFGGFDVAPQQTNLTNNGHTVAVTMKSDHIPTIAGGPLKGAYQYSQLHFHWGDNDTFGSEDMIDNHIFPMELHIVFFKQEYKNAKTALDHADGLTVLAFFYEVSQEDNPEYEEFVQLLGNVTSSHKSAAFVNPPSLKDLIARDVLHYYTYDGSLTTPPCSEVVTWIDFKEPILLSHAQIEAFRALENEEGHPLTHNFRPIQPIGDRVVLYNTDEVVKEDVDLTDDLPPSEVEQNSVEESTQEAKAGRKNSEDNGSVPTVVSWMALAFALVLSSFFSISL